MKAADLELHDVLHIPDTRLFGAVVGYVSNSVNGETVGVHVYWIDNSRSTERDPIINLELVRD
jgi:hypothetical protein